jgi:hypothetical protein
MTIRAKLFAALQGQADLGDRFDEVRERSRQEALAREPKFGVTDMNGRQTAYGYDGGRSRPCFLNSISSTVSCAWTPLRTGPFAPGAKT